jgi:hypothetical protein
MKKTLHTLADTQFKEVKLYTLTAKLMACPPIFRQLLGTISIPIAELYTSQMSVGSGTILDFCMLPIYYKCSETLLIL